jgi:hypothetical protein
MVVSSAGTRGALTFVLISNSSARVTVTSRPKIDRHANGDLL